jgi:hypothetical protein
MSELEWLTSRDPWRMLAFLEPRASDRKLRLFAVACCRRALSLGSGPAQRALVDAAEQRAEGSKDSNPIPRRKNGLRHATSAERSSMPRAAGHPSTPRASRPGDSPFLRGSKTALSGSPPSIGNMPPNAVSSARSSGRRSAHSASGLPGCRMKAVLRVFWRTKSMPRAATSTCHASRTSSSGPAVTIRPSSTIAERLRVIFMAAGCSTPCSVGRAPFARACSRRPTGNSASTPPPC